MEKLSSYLIPINPPKDVRTYSRKKNERYYAITNDLMISTTYNESKKKIKSNIENTDQSRPVTSNLTTLSQSLELKINGRNQTRPISSKWTRETANPTIMNTTLRLESFFPKFSKKIENSTTSNINLQKQNERVSNRTFRFEKLKNPNNTRYELYKSLDLNRDQSSIHCDESSLSIGNHDVKNILNQSIDDEQLIQRAKNSIDLEEMIDVTKKIIENKQIKKKRDFLIKSLQINNPLPLQRSYNEERRNFRDLKKNAYHYNLMTFKDIIEESKKKFKHISSQMRTISPSKEKKILRHHQFIKFLAKNK